MYRRYFITRCCLLGLLLSCVAPVRANDGLQADEVEKFRLECWSNPAYDLELNFAPVRRVGAESRIAGSWSYEFVHADRRYADGRVILPPDGAARVDLVTQLNRTDSDVDEGYLWAVIAAPKVKNWRFGGHWPVNKPITQYQRLTDKRDSLVSIASLSVYDGHPVHTLISPRDIDRAGSLNSAWETLFGGKIVSRLVYPASKSEDGYSLTFYYVPTPALRLIHDEGYRWPTFKHVDRPGKVFGFLLTAEGECLASTMVDVVRQ